MSHMAQRLISWAILAALLGGAVWVGQAELLRWHQREQLATHALQRDLALAQRQASELATREAALAQMQGTTHSARIFWEGPSPASALLDMQEFAGDALRDAGLSVVALEPVQPGADAPGLLRVTLRATGTLQAVQQSLFALERHDPKITVLRSRFDQGPERRGEPLMDVRFELAGLHQSAEKAQPAAE